MVKLRGYLTYIFESLFRWVSVPIETGLVEIGKPDENSPVFVTCNYDLTVRRVLKALKGLDCYLLIAPSNGINVWCASCGGDFNEHSIITAIKITDINEKVKHRTLILPQLSAPGIDTKRVYEETGWRVEFGPVYAKYIPSYIKNGYRKTEEMRLVKFGILDRIEMASIYFFTITLIMTPILYLIAKFFPNLTTNPLRWILTLTGLGAGIIYGTYLISPSLPIKSGVKRVILIELIVLLGLLSYGFTHGSPLRYLDMIAYSMLIAFLIGVDFNGTLPTEKSGLGEWYYKRGATEMKFLTGVYKLAPYGTITMDKENCINCGICIEVCPRGVYISDNGDVKLAYPEKCVNCHACEKQCPTQCLTIKPPI